MDRKTFCKSGCAAMVLLLGGISLSMESCATLPVHKVKAMENGIAEVPLTLFTENSAALVRVPQGEFDILLVKKNENEFIAIEMRCTHFSNPLVVSGNTLTCNAHGSQFNLDGIVETGPAKENLARFPVSLENSFLKIEIPTSTDL